MKIFISADIEGTAGITAWDEATKSNSPEHLEAREQMTKEVVAACEGAVAAGAREILIKDAHGTGRNIIASRLPKECSLIRGWSGHPFCMVEGLDESFNAAMMIGYHSRAGSDANPLSHTFRGIFAEIILNGKPASEFLVHSYVAAMKNVPVVFVSGDEGLSSDVKSFNEKIRTVAVSRGIGASTCSIHPALAVERIRSSAEVALKQDLSQLKIPLPERFELKIRFKDHMAAYRATFYPGVEKIDAYNVSFSTRDYFEVMRALLFFR